MRLITEEGVLKTVEALAGEPLSLPNPPTRTGYDFLGWYSDRAGKVPFSGSVTADTDVFAAYRLSAPTFSFSSISFTFDGEGHTLALQQLSHPLAASGVFSFSWEKDGVPLSALTSSLFLRNVSDSGSYVCHLTFSVGKESVHVSSPSVTVNVQKQKISIPAIPVLAYTGKEQYASVAPSVYYSAKAVSGIHAGTYPVLLTLADPDNTAFADTDAATVSADFCIYPALNAFTDAPRVSDVFLGEEVIPRYAVRFGVGYVLFSPSAEGDFTAELPAAVGTYYAKVVVDATDDYAGLVSDAIPFSVKKNEITALHLDAPPTRQVYTAFDTFSSDGLAVSAVWSDGAVTPVVPSDLCIKYAEGTCFHVGDTLVYLRYQTCSLALPVQVNFATYDLTGVSFPSFFTAYTGRFLTGSIDAPLPVGQDGIPLRVTIEGGGVNVGTYCLTAKFLSDSPEYQLPAPLTAVLTVQPAVAHVVWDTSGLTYTGKPVSPVATAYTEDGVPISLCVHGAQIQAGTSYTATVELFNDNYLPDLPSCPFSIAKATLDLSGVVWEGDAFLYDGERHSVRLSHLPEGVTVIGYADADATQAGTYTAAVTLGFDGNNYELPLPITHTWSIAKAVYDVPASCFLPTTAVYSGEICYPELSSPLPRGKDGSLPTYTFDVGALHVSDGTVSVEVRFASSSDNYLAPEPIYTSVTLTPRPIGAVWGNCRFTYSGESFLPSAEADECKLLVTGSGVNAGTYVARAVATNTDYTVVNDSAVFVIEKAENAWLLPLCALETYEGHPLPFHAEAAFGTVKYLCFSDPAGQTQIEVPTAAGVYYVRAFVPEGKNYKALYGTPAVLCLLPVLPIGVSVTLGEQTYRAFDTVLLQSAACVFNDGSTRPLSAEEVTVTYRKGDCLHAGDTSVCVTYQTFSQTLPVTVEKRVADLSCLSVYPTDLVYTGEEQSVCVVGCPEGFFVTDISGNRATEAGTYTLSYTLLYDPDNYVFSSLPPLSFVMYPRFIPSPTVPTAEYDGHLQTPALTATDDYTVSSEGGRHAGTYEVCLTLTDPVNTAWEVTEEKNLFLSFVILPRTLTVTVGDAHGYWDRTDTPTALLSSGNIVSGDTVTFSAYIENGRTLARCWHNDYILSVEPGTFVYENTLSPEAKTVLFTVLLTALVLSLFLFLSRKRRHRLSPPAMPTEAPPSDISPSEETFNASDALVSDEMPLTPPVPASDDAPDAPLAPASENFIDVPQTPDPEEVFSSSRQTPALEMSVSAGRADGLLSDRMAERLLGKCDTPIDTYGRRHVIINVDTLGEHFCAGERVDICLLKEKSLIPYDTGYLKVLARGMLGVPLRVYANAFSPAAVKMIALTGGEAFRCATHPISYAESSKKRDN